MRKQKQQQQFKVGDYVEVLKSAGGYVKQGEIGIVTEDYSQDFLELKLLTLTDHDFDEIEEWLIDSPRLKLLCRLPTITMRR